MSIIDTLITDRTKQDADYVVYLKSLWDEETGVWHGTASELAQWKAGMKGAYNAKDLNRVGEACVFVADLLRQAGYSITVSPKTDWTMQDMPTKTSMDAYLDIVRTLRSVLAIDAPSPPESMTKLTHTGANAIEKILLNLDMALTLMTQSWWYAGEVCAGE